MLALPIGLWWGNMTGPSYTFNLKVHSHMENAYFANTPELMITQLQECKQGMIDLGLTSDMYDAYWTWDRVPHRQMAYQYQHIDSIISRAEAVIEWRNENYGSGSSDITSESLGDVYEVKMDNLRGFLKEEGWSDWIAHGAYYANHHLLYYLGELIGTLWIVVFLVPIILLFWYVANKSSDWERAERQQAQDLQNQRRNFNPRYR
jgi:hypothetical protein